MSQRLVASLGLPGSVFMGLGAILGTGVFVSIGIAAGIVGSAVVPAIAGAALLALCNALSAAQLAAAHPVSGGTYEYGYRYLHPWLGFAAGWMFLCAKSASAATAALGFAGYLLYMLDAPQGCLIPVALLAVVVVTGVVLSGMRRSNRANFVIVSTTLVGLVYFVIAGAFYIRGDGGATLSVDVSTTDHQGTIADFLYATALMFVAFTGYGRIATLGEEVHAPRQTIPRAILITLFISAVVYMAVAIVAVGAIGPQALALATQGQAAPLQRVAAVLSMPGVVWIVGVAAITAMLGVLLNLILGLSRVLLAMGRRADMPSAVARLDALGHTPYVSVIVIGAVVLVLASIGSVETTWSFSAFTVLVYYAITNMAALRLPASDRRYPRLFSWLGLGGCLGLAFWVDVNVWLAGLAVLALGIAWRAVITYVRAR